MGYKVGLVMLVIGILMALGPFSLSSCLFGVLLVFVGLAVLVFALIKDADAHRKEELKRKSDFYQARAVSALHRLDFKSFFKLKYPYDKRIVFSTFAHAIKDGNYEQAMPIIEQNPVFNDLLIHGGHRCIERQDYSSALKWYLASYNYTQNVVALLHAGICCVYLQDYNQAKEYLKQVIQQQSSPIAWYHLLVAELKSLDIPAFLKTLQQARQNKTIFHSLQENKILNILISIPQENIPEAHK